MRKWVLAISLIAVVTVFYAQAGLGADPPHNWGCTKCHTMHGALGPSFTTSASNTNLCLSCHTTTGDASGKSLLNSMQAGSGQGTSHSWMGPLANSAMSAELPTTFSLISRIEGSLKGFATQDSSAANNVVYSYGTYTVNGLAGRIFQFFYTSPSSSGNKDVQRTISSNTANKIVWSPNLSNIPKANDRYVILPLTPKLTCSICHAQHTQTFSPWDPLSNTIYNASITNNRHMLRTNNNYNQLCEDCHRSRTMNYTRASGGDGAYPANGTNVFSHPVGDALNSQGYDFAAPLDANGAAQTNSPSVPLRFAGDVDGNPTNNQSLDSTGKVRCMSCHRMHYTDGNPMTNDVAP